MINEISVTMTLDTLSRRPDDEAHAHFVYGVPSGTAPNNGGGMHLSMGHELAKKFEPGKRYIVTVREAP